MLKSIITLTMNPSVDLSSTTPVVTDEKKLRCTAVRYDPGGGGINVSRAITTLGGRSKAFYPAGGHFGIFLDELLQRDHIDHVRFPILESSRINVSIIEDSSDKQYRFNMPGAKVQENEWQHILNSLRDFLPSPDFIIASGSLPPGVPTDFYRKVGQIAKQKNCKFIVDTANEPLRQALEGGVFLIKPNLNEFQQITGEKFQNEQEIIQEAQYMIQNNQSTYIIISLGAGGSFFITKDSYDHIRSPLVPIRSRVGAGDSMVAGITLKLAEGESIEDAVRYGISAGTAAVMTPGTELCRFEDTEQIYKTMINSNDTYSIKNEKIEA